MGEEKIPTRRTFLKAAGSAGAAVVLGARVEANTIPPFPEGLDRLDTMPVFQQIAWFQDKVGKTGSLWPHLRDARHLTDEHLRKIFAALATISKALNDPSPNKDPRVQQLKDSIGVAENFVHMYTLTLANGDSLVDIGNAQVMQHTGRPILRTAEHVVAALRKRAPHLAPVLDMFQVPPPLKRGDPLPDEAVALLKRVPIMDPQDIAVPELPFDFNPLNSLGQINIVTGFKADGGLVKTAGIVLPTPPSMARRIDAYLGIESKKDTARTDARIAQGGLMLMPRFFGESDHTDNPRARGRSGARRLVYSPDHKQFVPAGGYIVIVGNSEVNGLSVNYVDSASHTVRAIQTMEEKFAKSRAEGSILPMLSCEPERNKPGLWRIGPGLYLRSVRHRLRWAAQ